MLMPAQLAEEGNHLLATLPLLLLKPDSETGRDRQITHFLQFQRITPNIVQRAGDIYSDGQDTSYFLRDSTLR